MQGWHGWQDWREQDRRLDRRDWLAHSAKLAGLLMAAGVWPGQSGAAGAQGVADARAFARAFEAHDLASALRALGPSAPQESAEVQLLAPEIAENGAVVPVSAACSLAGVRRLMILVEKNPAPLAAVFELSEALEPLISTRVKMNETGQVYAVAQWADQRLLFARKEVKITLGGCGG